MRLSNQKQLDGAQWNGTECGVGSGDKLGTQACCQLFIIKILIRQCSRQMSRLGFHSVPVMKEFTNETNGQLSININFQ